MPKSEEKMRYRIQGGVDGSCARFIENRVAVRRKRATRSNLASLFAVSAAVVGFSTALPTASATVFTKANNLQPLSNANSYTANSGVPATAADSITWDSTFNTAGQVLIGTSSTAYLGTIGSMTFSTTKQNVDIVFGTSTTSGAKTVNWGDGTNTGTQTLVDMSAASNGTNNVTFDTISSGAGLFSLTGGVGSQLVLNVASNRTLTFNVAVGATANQKTLVLSGAGNIVFNNGITGSGSNPFGVNINGANVTLNATDGFNVGSKGFSLSSGVLTLGNASALSISGNPAVNLAGGRLGVNAAGSGLTYSTNFNVANSVMLGQDGNYSATFSGTISGSGTLSNYVGTGSGNTNAVTYTGDLSGFTGTINYTDAGATANSASWRVGSANLSNASVVLNAGTGANQVFGFSDGLSNAILQIGQLSGDGVFRGSSGGGTTSSTANVLQVGAKNTASSTFSGIIGVSGADTQNIALVKVGSGTLTLSGNNIYTGGTAINAGLLQANNAAGSTGSGAVSVSATGSLGGTGKVAGSVAIAGGGSLDLRDSSIGTLSLASTLQTTGATVLYVDYGTAGTDSIAVSSTMTLGGNVTVNLNNLSGQSIADNTYTLLSYSDENLNGNTIAFTGGLLSQMIGSQTFTLNNTASAETLTVVTPEPACFGIFAFASVTALSRRRRVGRSRH